MKIAYLNDLHIDSWIKFNNNEHKNRKKIEEFINTIFSKSEKECLEESSPDSCVKCYTMFLPFLLIKIDVFS